MFKRKIKKQAEPESSIPKEAEQEVGKNQEPEEYEVVEIEILPEKMVCPDCGGITLVGLEFCDKCGGELTNLEMYL